MVSQRAIKLTLAPLLALTLLISIVTLGLSAGLEAHWRNHGFPSISYRDRERILLAGSIWATVISIYGLVGALLFVGKKAFGIMFHVISFAIAFILLMIGSASLTALTRGTSCSDVTWSRCGVTKALVGFGWVDTILTFIVLVYTLFLGIKASRSGPTSFSRSALADA